MTDAYARQRRDEAANLLWTPLSRSRPTTAVIMLGKRSVHFQAGR